MLRDYDNNTVCDALRGDPANRDMYDVQCAWYIRCLK